MMGFFWTMCCCCCRRYAARGYSVLVPGFDPGEVPEELRAEVAAAVKAGLADRCPGLLRLLAAGVAGKGAPSEETPVFSLPHSGDVHAAHFVLVREVALGSADAEALVHAAMFATSPGLAGEGITAADPIQGAEAATKGGHKALTLVVAPESGGGDAPPPAAPAETPTLRVKYGVGVGGNGGWGGAQVAHGRAQQQGIIWKEWVGGAVPATAAVPKSAPLMTRVSDMDPSQLAPAGDTRGTWWTGSMRWIGHCSMS